MPRKKIDHVQEQRATLGEYERGLLKRYIIAKERTGYINSATGSIGGVALGAGILFAGWAYMNFKAPDVKNEIKDFVFSGLDSVADAFLPGTPVEMRRKAQALAKERGRIAKAQAVYCSFSSEQYSEQKCSVTFMEQDAYMVELEAFRADVTAAGIVPGSLLWNMIFSGLGDIDPNRDTNPNNDVTKASKPTAEDLIRERLNLPPVEDDDEREMTSIEIEMRKNYPHLFD